MSANKQHQEELHKHRWRKGHTQLKKAKEGESKRQTKDTATAKAIEDLENGGDKEEQLQCNL